MVYKPVTPGWRDSSKLRTQNEAKNAYLSRDPNLFSGYAKYAEPGLKVMGIGTTPQAPEPPSGGGGGGGGYSAPVDPFGKLKSQQAARRAQLEALYNAYTQEIGAGEAGIAQNYATAGKSLKDIYGGAVSDLNAAQAAVQNQRMAQLQALGLAEGYIPPSNEVAQFNIASDYQQLKAAALAENEARRQSALAGNQAIQRAAAGEKVASLKAYDQMAAQALEQAQAQYAAQQAAQARAAAGAAAAQARAEASARDKANRAAIAAEERDYRRWLDKQNLDLRNKALDIQANK